jgi:hypothetical protein
MSDGSNTANNSATGKPFKKGDARINRKGRPKTHAALQELAQKIGHEPVRDKNGDVVTIEGHAVTVTEVILRQWAKSTNPVLQKAFMEAAYGKAPTQVELSGQGGGPVAIVVEAWEDEETDD